MSYGLMMDHSLFRIRSYISDFECVCESTFMGRYSAIMSDSYDDVGTYVEVLIEFCLPRVFK